MAGQRETLLLSLKDCAAVQTVASLREAHLIITLLSIVLPSVPEDEVVSLFFARLTELRFTDDSLSCP